MSDAASLISQANILLEQVHHLYAQYFARVAKLPPLVERTRLEQIITAIDRAEKGTPAAKFQAQQVHAKFVTYRDLWDRKTRELEGRRL